jgi:hypothetical protein
MEIFYLIMWPLTLDLVSVGLRLVCFIFYFFFEILEERSDYICCYDMRKLYFQVTGNTAKFNLGEFFFVYFYFCRINN